MRLKSSSSRWSDAGRPRGTWRSRFPLNHSCWSRRSGLNACPHWRSHLFCSLAVLDPRVGHTMDVLSPFIPVLCHSDWLFHGESCPRFDVVHPGREWPSSPSCTWHCSLHYLFLQATSLFPHGVTIVWRSQQTGNKKLSYRRGTARCVVSIEILPIATQQCRNYLYDKSWPNRWYEVGDLVGGNAW